MENDDMPTGERAKALFHEWTHDYAAAKVRDEFGEAAVTPDREPAWTADRLRVELHDIGRQLDPGLPALLEAHGVAPAVRREVRAHLSDVLTGIARVGAVAVRDAERDAGRER